MYFISPESPKALGAIAFIRIAIGSMMIFHGIPKLIGGPERWAKVGNAMTYMGIDSAPEFWGFMAAGTETFGGLFLAMGLFSRPWLILLMINMTVALGMKLGQNAEFTGYAHPLELLLVFFGLFVAGSGPFSFDNQLFGKNKNAHHDVRV